jgi:hypothetical protein
MLHYERGIGYSKSESGTRFGVVPPSRVGDNEHCRNCERSLPKIAFGTRLGYGVQCETLGYGVQCERLGYGVQCERLGYGVQCERLGYGVQWERRDQQVWGNSSNKYTLQNIITLVREAARFPLALTDSSLSPNFLTYQNYHRLLSTKK